MSLEDEVDEKEDSNEVNLNKYSKKHKDRGGHHDMDKDPRNHRRNSRKGNDDLANVDNASIGSAENIYDDVNQPRGGGGGHGKKRHRDSSGGGQNNNYNNKKKHKKRKKEHGHHSNHHENGGNEGLRIS